MKKIKFKYVVKAYKDEKDYDVIITDAYTIEEIENPSWFSCIEEQIHYEINQYSDPDNNPLEYEEYKFIEIIDRLVYTGLTDKNDDEIYKGDIWNLMDLDA